MGTGAGGVGTAVVVVEVEVVGAAFVTGAAVVFDGTNRAPGSAVEAIRPRLGPSEPSADWIELGAARGEPAPIHRDTHTKSPSNRRRISAARLTRRSSSRTVIFGGMVNDFRTFLAFARRSHAEATGSMPWSDPETD